MAVYRCRICGAIFDEAKEGKKLSEIPCCPVCKQPISNFEKIADAEETKPDAIASSVTAAADAVKAEPAGAVKLSSASLAYDEAYARVDERCRYMKEIHEMAVTGRTIGGAMGTQMPMPGWDDILLLGAQLNPPPLEDDAPVETRTVIGKHAKKPMVLDSPVYISHMSFGALSKETKVALAKGSALAKTAMCSGEGGILPEEKAASYKYIFEYIPNKYSVTDENLKTADAIEIKIGQGTKPGMGGHLPGEKVTPEIAALRGKKPGEDVQSPSKFPEINSKEDLKAMVDMLRERSEGRPIGIKIAAGRIEQDLEHCVFAQPDFITIDGRGGAYGSHRLCLKPRPEVSGFRPFRHCAGDYRRAAGIAGLCQSAGHGGRCHRHCQCGADCGGLPAVSHLRFGKLSYGHCHTEPGTASPSEHGSCSPTGSKFPERFPVGTENLCPHHRSFLCS